MFKKILLLLLWLAIWLGLFFVTGLIMAKLLCFIFTITYSTTFMLKVLAGMLVVQEIGYLLTPSRSGKIIEEIFND